MTEWGWNPATLQAVGGLATAVALFGVIASAIFSFRNMAESSLRTRPWIGVTEIRFVAADDTDGYGWDALLISYENVGVLPSHSTEVAYKIFGEDEDVPDGLGDPVQTGPIFPRDPSSVTTGEAMAETVTGLIAKNQTCHIRGVIRYRFGTGSFVTEFSGAVDFADVGNPKPEYNNDRVV